MTTTPTIILVHESFHQAAHYIDFDAALQSVGLNEVRIPQLPSCSYDPPEKAFEADINIARKTILSCLNSGREVMLVAHGYGGKVISDALAEVPFSSNREHVKVLGIVFVAGVVCEEGESRATSGGEAAPAITHSDDLVEVADPSNLFLNTLTSKAALDKATALFVPFAKSAGAAAAKTASWSRYQCAYVQCVQDRAFPVSSQERCVAKLKKRCEWDPAVAKLDCDHDPFLSQPGKLAGMVKRLVDDALE